MRLEDLTLKDSVEKILALFDIKNPLNSKEIVVGMYRLYRINVTNQRVKSLIGYLKKSGSVNNEWGIYHKNPSLIINVKHHSVNIFNLADTQGLNDKCISQITTRKKANNFRFLSNAIISILEKNDCLSIDELQTEISRVCKISYPRIAIKDNLKKLIRYGVIKINSREQFFRAPILKKFQKKYGIIWKRKYDEYLLQLKTSASKSFP